MLGFDVVSFEDVVTISERRCGSEGIPKSCDFDNVWKALGFYDVGVSTAFHGEEGAWSNVKGKASITTLSLPFV